MAKTFLPRTPAHRTDSFVGREYELKALQGCADDVRSGQSRLVLIEGEAGIGKTALLTSFVDRLTDFAVLTASCDPVETELRFGVVRQLALRLPTAVLAGFPFLAGAALSGITTVSVGAEVVQLVGRLQNRGPVAVVVDDAQWSDKESLQALRFALRRLWADQVLTLLTTRSTSGPTDPAPTAAARPDLVLDWSRLQLGGQSALHLRLTGLDATEIGQLAAQVGNARVSRPLAEKLQRYTAGHPLWLRILLDELPEETLTDVGVGIPVPPSLASMVRGQLSRLPASSRALMEALAVLDSRCPLALAAGVAGIESPATALEPALQAALVDWWPTEVSSPVRIRHPLLREAIYSSLDPVRRRELHASAVPQVAPDASWTHRVASAERADGKLAAELDEAAARLLQSGDAGRAATLLGWAADVSDSRPDRERRILSAASHLLASQQIYRARALRRDVESCSPSPMRSCVLGGLTTYDGRFASAEQQLLAAQAEAAQAPTNTTVAAISARALAGLYAWTGDGEKAVRAARQALAIGMVGPHVENTTKTLLLLGMLQWKGARAALEESQALRTNPTDGGPTPAVDAYLLAWNGAFRLLVGQLNEGIDDMTAALRRAQDAPSTQVYVHSHYWLCHAHYLRGDWADAAIDADRALAVATAENRLWLYAPVHAAAAMVAAGRGHWDQANEHVGAAQTAVAASGLEHYVVYPALAAATIAQARGDAEGMLEAISPILQLPRHYGWALALQPWWLPLHTEALVSSGRFDAAAEELRRLEETSRDVPYLRQVHAWQCALLADKLGNESAQSQYEAALALRAEVPLYRALLELAYGRFLATHRDRASIRWLRRAEQRFSALGAQPFLRRCLADISGPDAGVSASVTKLLDLTDREQQIAHVVAGGRTNAEAARELYVSEKTIEYHLSHIYAKLGITTRRELRSNLEPLR